MKFDITSLAEAFWDAQQEVIFGPDPTEWKRTLYARAAAITRQGYEAGVCKVLDIALGEFTNTLVSAIGMREWWEERCKGSQQALAEEIDRRLALERELREARERAVAAAYGVERWKARALDAEAKLASFSVEPDREVVCVHGPEYLPNAKHARGCPDAPIA